MRLSVLRCATASLNHPWLRAITRNTDWESHRVCVLVPSKTTRRRSSTRAARTSTRARSAASRPCARRGSTAPPSPPSEGCPARPRAECRSRDVQWSSAASRRSRSCWGSSVALVHSTSSHAAVASVGECRVKQKSIRASVHTLRIHRAYELACDCGIAFSSEVCTGGLDGVHVLVVPGGSSLMDWRLLGKPGRWALRRFVEAGGGYVGICAGAFLGLAAPKIRRPARGPLPASEKGRGCAKYSYGSGNRRLDFREPRRDF